MWKAKNYKISLYVSVTSSWQCLDFSSPYVVWNEFSGYARNFQTEYALLPLEEKKKVKNTLLMFWVNKIKVVKNFKVGSIAIANARSDTIKALESTCTITKKSMSEKSRDKNKALSNQIASIKAVIINSITLFIQ